MVILILFLNLCFYEILEKLILKKLTSHQKKHLKLSEISVKNLKFFKNIIISKVFLT